MDTVLLNALVFDGSGAKPYISSVHIKPPRIHAVFDFAALSTDAQDELRASTRIVDCQNGALAVCPGFIDMHAHSDLSLMHTPSHLAKITQGCTTEVLGQDGIGYAPVNDECLARIRQQIAGWNGNPEDPEFWAWRSVKQYLDILESRKVATNVAFLVPQGNLRMLVLGYDPRRASDTEVREMQTILQQALADGAFGMSSGLTYVPGMYAPDSELAQLLPSVREVGGYFCPHHRSYGKGALQAYAEMLSLAEQTGVHLHLAHAILNFEENAGRAPDLLEMLKKARSSGIHVSLDTYPYLPGSTTLAAQLPSWAAAGGPAQTVERLQTPDILEKIRFDVEVKGTDGCHGCTIDWGTIEISGVENPALKKIVGKNIAEIVDLGLIGGAATGFDAMVAILLEDSLATTILQHVGHEENVRQIMSDEFHCGGSDGILTSAKPHPRGHGCFTRFLGHYARELPEGRERDVYAPAGHSEDYKSVEPFKAFAGGMADAIAHLTSRPAAVLGLKDRGLVAAGNYADLVVFEPESVRDCSTFAEPTLPSKGIQFVFVNGQIAIDTGKPTHARNGMVLRKNIN